MAQIPIPNEYEEVQASEDVAMSEKEKLIMKIDQMKAQISNYQ